jgi:hypothetical protein
MGVSLRFGEGLGWGYHDDVTGGPPPLHFTPVGPEDQVYWPAPRPVTQLTPGCAAATPPDMTAVGRDPSDPTTWGARPYRPAAGMIGRLNGSGEGP